VAADLLQYYQNELRYLRQLGAEFADKYPAIASGLLLESRKDPHIERLIDSFAFLAARIHRKLDDDFPEVTQALLHSIYPHYLRPIPSACIVEMQVDPQQAKFTTGLPIPRGTGMESQPVRGMRCRFRTCFDTMLWPFEVAAAEWKRPDRLQPAVRHPGAVAAIRIELRCDGELTFAKLRVPRLRFYLNGSPELAHALYEVLLNNCQAIFVRDPSDPNRPATPLPVENLQPAGFDEEDALLPYPRRSFDGYRLLQEYFTLPEKFQFLDLDGFDRVAPRGGTAEIVFLLSPFEREERWQLLETGVNARVFRTGCTPVVNLFAQASEPVLLNHTETEYLVVPDVRRGRHMEVFSIDGVKSIVPGSGETLYYDEFYSFRHTDGDAAKQTFWTASRRAAPWREKGGSDMYLTLVDVSGRPRLPDADAVTVNLTCTNRQLPEGLPFGVGQCVFELPAGTPAKRAIALVKPTASLPPPSDGERFWRLVSHLALNHLSIIDGGREALQHILRLYNFSGFPPLERQIQGIQSVRSRPHFAAVSSGYGIAFARGTAVEMSFDEGHFEGGGVFLFASVIERFLGMYASLNSFTQLIARTKQRKEVLRQWRPRSGRKILA
jgi:type VI secretion system protein ImpG